MQYSNTVKNIVNNLDIASGKIKSKGYDDVDEMIHDILYAAEEEPEYNK